MPRPRLPALALLLLCWAACPARAQEAPPHADEAPAPRTAPQPRPAPAAKTPPRAPGPTVKSDGKRHLRSLDENHDGRIARKEFLARAREAFAELDLDHDGILSPAELRKAGERQRQKRDAERKRAAQPPVRRKEGDRPHLAHRDLDGDGRITLKEYLARREETFARLDKNRDGVLSREEAGAEKRRILARRAEIQTERKAVADRRKQRQAVRDGKQAARERRQERRAEIAAEREARAGRRMERMARQAESQWALPPEAAALAPEPPPAAAP